MARRRRSSSRDHTELARANEALRALMSSARCLMWQAKVDDRGHDLHWHDVWVPNEEWAEGFMPLERNAPERYITAWRNARHPDDEESTLEHTQSSIRAGRDYLVEYRVRGRAGECRWFCEHVKVQVRGPGRWKLTGVVVDITQNRELLESLRESERRLHMATHQLLAVQENERRFLARELHDEIGQLLTALKLLLQSSLREQEHEQSQARISESIAVTDQVISRVRNLSTELRPSVLDDLGLSSALRWYVGRFAERTDTEVTLDSDELEMRPDFHVETACYRIVLEALNNIARHAHARHVTVSLRRENGGLCLTVHDDGRGFDVQAARARAASGNSLGLLSMEERATLAGGRLSIESSGTGTLVTATFKS